MKIANYPKGTSASLWRLVSIGTSPRSVHLLGEPFFLLLGSRHSEGSINDFKLYSSETKKILIVRLDEIGDIVLTIPFIRELRRNLPDAWITLIVKPEVYNLVELCPYVNDVQIFDKNVPRSRPETVQLHRHVRAIRLASKYLWSKKFDLAIVPRWDADYYHATFLSYFSGAPWRVGYSETVIAHKKEINKDYDSLLTHAIKDGTLKHEVEHNLDVIRFLGGQVLDDRLELWLSEGDMAFAKDLLRGHGAKSNDLLIAFAPGAGAGKRMWPINRFAQLGSWLQNAYRARILIIGGPGEEALGHELKQLLGSNAVNTADQTTLREAAALLSHCQLFIGNDAGPMHMAAAVNMPIIEISCHPRTGSPYSANSPKRFGPWKTISTILQPDFPQPPCTDECIADHPHCILGVTVERVKRAAEKHLKSTITKENPT